MRVWPPRSLSCGREGHADAAASPAAAAADAADADADDDAASGHARSVLVGVHVCAPSVCPCILRVQGEVYGLRIRVAELEQHALQRQQQQQQQQQQVEPGLHRMNDNAVPAVAAKEGPANEDAAGAADKHSQLQELVDTLQAEVQQLRDSQAAVRKYVCVKKCAWMCAQSGLPPPPPLVAPSCTDL